MGPMGVAQMLVRRVGAGAAAARESRVHGPLDQT